MRNQTVVVLFDVLTGSPAEAEQIVADRLDAARLLQQNDSTDVAAGTTDPIVTFVVVPSTQLLDDSI